MNGNVRENLTCLMSMDFELRISKLFVPGTIHTNKINSMMLIIMNLN